MIHPTTGRYLTQSLADDRARGAARERRLALAASAPKLVGTRPVRFTTAARFAALLVWPFRNQVAPR